MISYWYTEIARGNIDTALMKVYSHGYRYAVARTEYGVVRLCPGYRFEDYCAVVKFAEQYNLPIDWDRSN